MEQLIILVILIVLGYVAGIFAEKKHYQSIIKREKDLVHLPAVGFKHYQVGPPAVAKAELVVGNAVIAVDYFKRILAGLRNIFGGNVKSYESLVDRARREAMLRMKEQANGAEIIINVRLETSTIGKSGKKQNVTSVESMAYGTALYIEK